MTVTTGRGRSVYFVDILYDADCVSDCTITEVLASRWRAKKLISYVRSRCLACQHAEIRTARQHDLIGSGWQVMRRRGRINIDDRRYVEGWHP